MLEPLTMPFFQRGLAEVLLLAVASGVLGTWIVLRGLGFLAHAVGTATFPGLVLADGLGFSATLGAFGTGLLAAALMAALATRRRTGPDSVTALVLAAALAAGIVLASDVFSSQASVDRLLFGSLLLIDAADLRLAAAAAVIAVAADRLLGPRWLAAGFAGARPRGRGPDLVLVLLVALVAVALLAAVGALLAVALLVVPAATARLFTARLRTWRLATVALAALEGVAGMWVSYLTDAPPGAGIAVIGSGVFVLAVVLRALGTRRRVALAAAAALAALALGGCGGSPSGGRPDVVATTTQIADMAREIGGPRIGVRGILRSNTDPHEYEPRPSDLRAVADARVVLTSGLGLDAWATQVIGDSGTDARVVDVGAGVPNTLAAADAGEGLDPHWWQDPLNAIAATRTIEAALAAALPGDRAAIARRAEAYRLRLERLDRDIRGCIERVPAGQRRIVTDHDAFGQFARRYGIEVVGAVIPSGSTRAQASAGELAQLERTIRREGVVAVFPEASVNAKLAEQIARDTGASAEDTLLGDTLGPEGSRSGTYAGMLAANTEALVRGMSGGGVTCRVGT